MRKRGKKLITAFVLVLIIYIILGGFKGVNGANAQMPFYGLQPKDLVLRSTFYTTYSASSEERKNNINLATKSLNNVLVDVKGEFSFNKTVGVRSEKRGYKQAKIIVKGEFVEGVGGGVCQVSTTLYNAVLLAGLKVTEYHQHSLPVSYVAPSFDAMVNSGSADLRFYNNTHNPVIIKASSNGDTVKIDIYGEPMKERYIRKSEKIQDIVPEDYLEIVDEKKEYPDLMQGEKRIITYAKNGYKSKGILIKKIGDKTVEEKVIRQDTYKPIRGVVIIGTT